MTETIQTQGSFAVDTSRGTSNHTVSSQWFSRPPDQRFLSLGEVFSFTKRVADNSTVGVINSKDIQVSAPDGERLELGLPETHNSAARVVRPTHWSFGQVCGLVQAPAKYLRQLPAQIAGVNLQYGLSSHRAELVKAYNVNGDDSTVTELKAMTGPDYGRIFDYEVVSAVQKIAGNGTGDARWKVPGKLNWSTHTYNPDEPVTKDSTTLFASDRDIFLFLVDDKRPIEIGKLDNGCPDYVFRGFYICNSEVGSKTLTVATMYLRGICCNRILWGVEGFQELSIRHSKAAPDKFLMEVTPALNSYAEASTGRFLEGVSSARKALVADNSDKRTEFLQNRGFTSSETTRIIASVTKEEGHPPSSIWDFVQGITRVAQEKVYQDERIELERKAQKLLDNV